MSLIERDFKEDMAREQQDTLRVELRSALKKLYPTATGMRRVRDLRAQKSGTDAIIMFPAPMRPITVDFKFRSAEQDHPDFCLEYSHDYDDGVCRPGWVCDDSKVCDFFIYVQKKTWTCWELPRARTQWAWQSNEAIWRARFFCNRTRNQGWWTNWCAVPREAYCEVVGPIRYEIGELNG